MKDRIRKKWPGSANAAAALIDAPPIRSLRGHATALSYLVRDTFRQSLHAYSFWLMLTLSALCIVFCLSIDIVAPHPMVQPDDIEIRPDRGYITFGFGAFRVPLFRDGVQAVHFIQALMGKWVAGTAGLLLALIWTAGFVPSFLEPQSATVLLAKPTPRWLLLLGKYLGVFSFVTFQAALFVFGTWWALGLKTGIWDRNYLLTFPLFLVHFSVVYSFSLMLAVCTRSTVVSVFGSVVLWLLCYGLNYGRHLMVALPYLDAHAPAIASGFQAMVEAGYWCLPKPADFTILLDNALQSNRHFQGLPEFATVQRVGAFNPLWSIFSSIAFAVVLFLISARQLAKTDY